MACFRRIALLLLLPKLSDFDLIGRHARWIPVEDPAFIGAFAGMTNKSQWVPVMPVPDFVRDDGFPMNAGSSTGIQPIMALCCPNESLNSGIN